MMTVVASQANDVQKPWFLLSFAGCFVMWLGSYVGEGRR